jgi:hypothetical protein
MNFLKTKGCFFVALLLFIFSPQLSIAQSKKEQISILQVRIDSLNAVLADIKEQLDLTAQQLKEKTAYASDIEAQLKESKRVYQVAADNLAKSEIRSAELNGLLIAKGTDLLNMTDKNGQLNSQIDVLNDSLSKSNTRLRELSNQLADVKSERDQLKRDLEKQAESSANSESLGETLWCDLSDVNGVYTMQKRNPDWDFPPTITVKIDTKKITFNAFKELRTYDYGMKAVDGTIHLVFGEVSEETGDYLGGGKIYFTAEGIKMSVITGPAAEIEQDYFKRVSK